MQCSTDLHQSLGNTNKFLRFLVLGSDFLVIKGLTRVTDRPLFVNKMYGQDIHGNHESALLRPAFLSNITRRA